MKNILLGMYKQLPKALKQQKTDLVFYLSEDVFKKEKAKIFNNRFLGINIQVEGMIAEDTAYLTESPKRKLTGQWKK